MSKVLDILMAGIISGLVAYTTSKLGFTGTIIGAVLGSMLFQLMSHIFRSPLENVKTHKVESSLFFVFPLVIILGIEILYLLLILSLSPGRTFYLLENITGWNLFRTMGIALVIMGLYPLLEPENISKRHGYLLLAVGAVTLLGGFVDYNSSLVEIYSPIFYQLNEVISILVVAALLYVIVTITRESVTIIYEDDQTKVEKAE